MDLILDNSKHFLLLSKTSALTLIFRHALEFCLQRRVTATMSQDNDTAEQHLGAHYEVYGSFQLEAYEFGQFFVPFLMDESTDTSQSFMHLLLIQTNLLLLRLTQSI